MVYIHCYKIDENTKQVSKALLHKNLSDYMQKEASEIIINYNKNGKPHIQGINFSVSHCKNQIVQAFSKKGELGIDIEFKNYNRKFIEMAKRYFHADEYDYLSSLNHADALTMFYNLWTTKEAICKAKGGRLWNYLADKYINNHNEIITEYKGLKILQFNEVKNYSLSMAMQFESATVEIIHE